MIDIIMDISGIEVDMVFINLGDKIVEWGDF